MILFNLRCTQPDGKTKRHGGGIYGEIVFKRIIARKLPVCAYYDSENWLNPEIKEIIINNNITLFDIRQLSLKSIIRDNDIKLVYTPLFGRDFGSFHDCKVIGTLHGLRDLEMPNDKIVTKYRPFFKNWCKFHLRDIFSFISRANRFHFVEEISANKDVTIVVVSNHTACSYKANYPQYSSRMIPVFYSPSTVNETICFNSDNKENFFLIVSANRWEKNALRAIIAIDDLASNGVLPADFRVVVTGASSSKMFGYKIKNLELFDFKGYVSDEELANLYHHAYCLIYPSLNEGFGYPPIEAMYHRTPVLASAICSIPEICGDAALYFSPFSINEIKCRIIQILDVNVHELMAKKGNERFVEIQQRQKEDLDKLIDYIYEK